MARPGLRKYIRNRSVAQSSATGYDDATTSSRESTPSSRRTRRPKPASREETAGHRPVRLFLDYQDKTEEALTTFELLEHNEIVSEGLGRTFGKESFIKCDCVKQVVDGVNIACRDNCINRITNVECIGKTTCGRKCRNRRFQRREYAQLDIIQTVDKGYGIRACKSIPGEGFVIEYVGDVISTSEFAERTLQYSKQHLPHFYFMQLQKNEYIDATKRGGIARFANHSCYPNCHIEKWIVNGELRMGIFAKRDIQPGEEITFDYNVDRSGAALQWCHCGEPNCRKVLGGSLQTSLGSLVRPGLTNQLQPESVSVPAIEPGPQSGAEPGSEVDLGVEVEVEVEPEPKSKSKAEPEPEREREPEPEPNAEPEYITISDDDDDNETKVNEDESKSDKPDEEEPEVTRIELDPMWIEALDLDDDQIEHWKHHLMKNLEKVTSNTQVQYSPPVNMVHEDKVGQLMKTLLQCKEEWLVSVVINRIYTTSNPDVDYQVMRLHGYQVFSQLLQNFDSCIVMTDHILKIMRRWPRQTKNKISASSIEKTTTQLANDFTKPEHIQADAEYLLSEWSYLKEAYTIPKKSQRKPVVVETISSSSESEQEKKSDPVVLKVNKKKEEMVKLPKGWRANTAPGGHVYYYNKELNITQWERPTNPNANANSSRNGSKETAKGKGKGTTSSKPKPAPSPLSDDKKSTIEKIISNATTPKTTNQDRSHSTPATPATPEQSSKTHQPSTDTSTLLKRTFAVVVPNFVAKYNNGHFGHDNCKHFSKEIVKTLVDKEMRKPEVRHPDRLSDEKRAKIKEFVKIYMHKAIKKHQARHTSHSHSHSTNQSPVLQGQGLSTAASSTSPPSSSTSVAAPSAPSATVESALGAANTTNANSAKSASSSANSANTTRAPTTDAEANATNTTIDATGSTAAADTTAARKAESPPSSLKRRQTTPDSQEEIKDTHENIKKRSKTDETNETNGKTAEIDFDD